MAMAAVADDFGLPPKATTAYITPSQPVSLPASPASWFKQPLFHLKAPRGWLNDPCAPGYDPATGTWHLFYQWNPNSCAWGDIAWGHYTSLDGVRWTHQGTQPALQPDQPYDDKGVYTGCFWPTGPRHEKKGEITVVYSSVTRVPTLLDARNCAGVALATSSDGGRTWQKSKANPVLKSEPDGLNVTGFRDPYLAPWPDMDRVRGRPAESSPKMLYGVLSGGIVGQGPNLFVYAVPADDLASWTYLGPLVNIPVDFCRPSHWSGDFGINWECANFMTLGGGGRQQDFLVFSTEGGFPRRSDEKLDEEEASVALDDAEKRCGSWTMWIAGSLQKAPEARTLGAPWKPSFSGLLDCGTLYAPNSYEHPVTGERVCWGWIKEDQLSLARRESRGWSGYLSLPRELFLLRLPGVVRAWKTALADIPSIEVSPSEDEDKVQDVYTLGIRPAPNLAILRREQPRVWTSLAAAFLPSVPHFSRPLTTARSAHWEMQATIRVVPGIQRIGFHVRHSPDLAQRVGIYWVPDEEKLVVDTRLASSEPDLSRDDVLSGPLTLFSLRNGDGAEEVEQLSLHIFSDGDVLEVFANNRFALSTAVYGDSNVCRGISCFAEGDNSMPLPSGSVFESIILWDELSSVDRTGKPL